MKHIDHWAEEQTKEIRPATANAQDIWKMAFEFAIELCGVEEHCDKEHFRYLLESEVVDE